MPIGTPDVKHFAEQHSPIKISFETGFESENATVTQAKIDVTENATFAPLFLAEYIINRWSITRLKQLITPRRRTCIG